tara:strand:+ start:53200 stop:55431 length:2232 start_codon:yes stop_codon:yes gene_type:complete
MRLSARSAETEPGAGGAPGAQWRRLKTAVQTRLNSVFVTLRTKVVAVLACIGLVICVVSGLFVHHVYEGQVEARVMDRLTTFTDVVARSIEDAKSGEDITRTLKVFSSLDVVRSVAVADPSGQIISAIPSDLAGSNIHLLGWTKMSPMLESANGHLVRDKSLPLGDTAFARRIEVPLAGGTGTIYLRIDLRPMLQTVQATAWSLVVWLIAGIVIAVLLVSLIIQRILVTPIEALRDYAERHGAGDFDFGIGPADEISMIARQLAGAFRDTHENEERIADLAETDGLTGLGNRQNFKARLAHEIARIGDSGTMIGVMVLNLDNFKVINDSLGHDVGDRILKRTGEILRACQRPGDMIARLGGDEFGVILTGLEALEDSADIAHRLVRAVGAPFRVEGHDLNQTACVGLTVYPHDGRDSDVLIKNADLALSQAKQEGSGACVLYRHELHLRAMERNSIERDLRAALARKQFVLYYQPKVDIRTGRINGAEALIRWMHPERGMVPPDMFIPVAERCGIISDVTRWVLDEACRQNRIWQDQGLPKIGVAVNVSAVDLRRSDLTDIVANTLVAQGLSPQYLELEVTESMVMRDVDVVIGTLRRLRSLGVGIGIDDFGTGYSSLAYLKRFPVKRLKIDRSFINDIADGRSGNVIPKVIIDLAHALGVDVLAEGVEDLAQLDILRDLGCDEAQGYFLGRPMPANEFAEFLRQSVEGPGQSGNGGVRSSGGGQRATNEAPPLFLGFNGAVA